MKNANCFYLRMLPTTKSDRVKAMCSNFGLTVVAVDSPHAVLQLKNVASRKNVEEKLTKCALFSQVTFVGNFNIEH